MPSPSDLSADVVNERSLKPELLNALIDSLRDEPDAWRWGGSDLDSQIIHRSGVALWIWAGSARVWTPRIDFGFWGKKRLRAAFRQWRRVRGNEIFESPDSRNVRAVLAKLKEGE